MTYYHHIVLQMGRSLYPNQDLTDRIISAKQYMDQHYSSPLCLDEVAQTVYISKFHFIRLYKKYYGQTPHTHLQEIRLTKAKELLRKGIPVRQVCLAIGFDSVPSFTRLYK